MTLPRVNTSMPTNSMARRSRWPVSEARIGEPKAKASAKASTSVPPCAIVTPVSALMAGSRLETTKPSAPMAKVPSASQKRRISMANILSSKTVEQLEVRERTVKVQIPLNIEIGSGFGYM